MKSPSLTGAFSIWVINIKVCQIQLEKLQERIGMEICYSV